MIAAWMLYSSVVAALLLVAGFPVEFLARAFGRPSRSVWTVVLAVALLFAGTALFGDWTRAAADQGAASGVIASPRSTGLRTGATLRPVAVARPTFATLIGHVWSVGLRLPIDEAGLRRFDAVLTGAAAASSAVALLVLLGGLSYLRRIERTLDAAVIDGVPVLLSHDLGPALVGVFQPHIVLPRWVAELPAHERRVVIAHEQEHARAMDPLLLLAAHAAVVLQPWNPALWGLVARLRFATEVDCDARVLQTAGERRGYGALLLKVYERSVRGIAARAAFVDGSSNLERRMRRMAAPTPRVLSLRGTAAMLAAASFAVLALSLRLPAQDTLRARHVNVKAGPEDFEPMVQREVSKLFAGFTLTPEQRVRAVEVVRRTQRQQWDLIGQDVPAKERRLRKPVPHASDSLVALAVLRDSLLAQLFTSAADRERFTAQATAVRREQFQHLDVRAR